MFIYSGRGRGRIRNISEPKSQNSLTAHEGRPLPLYRRLSRNVIIFSRYTILRHKSVYLLVLSNRSSQLSTRTNFIQNARWKFGRETSLRITLYTIRNYRFVSNTREIFFFRMYLKYPTVLEVDEFWSSTEKKNGYANKTNLSLRCHYIYLFIYKHKADSRTTI